jgi:AP-2 complex subunit alpha
MTLALESVKPFSEAPEMTVSFTEINRGVRTRYLYPLRLPITATCFFDPVVLEKNDFMQRWKALEGEDKEIQEVFTSAQPLSPQLIQTIRTLFVPALHLGLGVGLDTDLTVTACASFRTGTANPEGGGTISVGTMMRLEGDAAGGRFRITVRAKHKAICLALKNVLKAQLS